MNLPGRSSSRPPPPRVDPVELNGVRYEQARTGIPLDANDPSGWLRARRVGTDEELWLKQVYQRPPREPEPSLPSGGQSVIYMRTLRISGDRILVEDILGRSFAVDPITGASPPVS